MSKQAVVRALQKAIQSAGLSRSDNKSLEEVACIVCNDEPFDGSQNCTRRLTSALRKAIASSALTFGEKRQLHCAYCNICDVAEEEPDPQPPPVPGPGPGPVPLRPH